MGEMKAAPELTSSQHLTPNDLFKRMVIQDKIQNEKLSSRLDLANGGKSRTTIAMRFIVCSLGLLSIMTSQMSRMVLNQSVPNMVDPRMMQKKTVSVEGSCPWPKDRNPVQTTTMCDIVESDYATTLEPMETETTTTTFVESTTAGAQSTSTRQTARVYPTTTATVLAETTTASAALQELTSRIYSSIRELNSESPTTQTWSDKDDMVRSAESDHPRAHENIMPDNKTSEQQISSGNGDLVTVDKFMWSVEQQQILMDGFYYSYSVFMVLSGRLAEKYGAKYVLMTSVAGSAIINLCTPWMARKSFPLLVLSRVVMGAIQSGVFPGMYALFAKWLTIGETSIFAPLIKLNLQLGMMCGALVSGLIGDWPNVFYFTGFVCTLWCVLWFFLATSTPQQNTWVSREELVHIMRKKRQPVAEEPEALEMADVKVDSTKSTPAKSKPKSKSTPWLKIFTSPTVIALICSKLTYNFALDFLAIQLASYLNYVIHASNDQISAISTSMFALQAVLVVFVGWFAKSMVEKRPFNVSKTTIRKCFQGTANFGLAISLILVTFNNCDLIYLGIVLQLVSFLSMFVAGGETMLPYDLSDEFPATIAAVANSVANISGIVTTGLATWIVGKQGGSMTRWHKLIYLYSGANFVGGLAFSIFVKAEPIDSDSSKRKSTFETDIEPNAIMVEPISYKQVETTPTYNVAEQSKEVGTQDKVPDATETKKTP